VDGRPVPVVELLALGRAAAFEFRRQRQVQVSGGQAPPSDFVTTSSRCRALRSSALGGGVAGMWGAVVVGHSLTGAPVISVSSVAVEGVRGLAPTSPVGALPPGFRRHPRVEVGREETAAQIADGCGAHTVHVLPIGSDERQVQAGQRRGTRQPPGIEPSDAGFRGRDRGLGNGDGLRKFTLGQVRCTPDATQGSGEVEGLHAPTLARAGPGRGALEGSGDSPSLPSRLGRDGLCEKDTWSGQKLLRSRMRSGRPSGSSSRR
jgi:hypothetical protein